MSATRLHVMGEIDLTRAEETDRRSAHEAEFDRLYAENSHRVIGLVRRFIADEDVVDDIVQETFLRAYNGALHLEYLESHRQRDQWPWLAAVARNLALDNLRRRRIIREEDLDSELLEIDAPMDNPEVHLHASRQRHGIAEALDSVCPRQRRILVLKEVHGLACRDIADREGISVPALKSALARARRSFREAYMAIAERGGLGVVTGGILTRVRTRLRSWRDRALANPDAAANAIVASPAAAGAATAMLVVLGVAGVMGVLDSGSSAGGPPPTPAASFTQPAAEVVTAAAPVFTAAVTPEPDQAVAAVAEPASTPPAEVVAGAPPASTAPTPPGARGDTSAEASVHTDEVVPVEDPPAGAGAGGQAEQTDQGFDLDFDTAIDQDGDGTNDGSSFGGVSGDCPPPEKRTLAGSVVCPAFGDLSKIT